MAKSNYQVYNYSSILRIIFIIPFVIWSCKEKVSKEDNDALVKTAFNFYKNGNYKEAIKIYTKLILKDSEQGAYYFARGEDYALSLKRDSAISDYERSIKLNFRKGGSYYNIGLLNCFTNDSLALIYFKMAIDIYVSKNAPKQDIEKIQNEYNECLKRLKSSSIIVNE